MLFLALGVFWFFILGSSLSAAVLKAKKILNHCQKNLPASRLASEPHKSKRLSKPQSQQASFLNLRDLRASKPAHESELKEQPISQNPTRKLHQKHPQMTPRNYCEAPFFTRPVALTASVELKIAALLIQVEQYVCFDLPD